MTKDRDEFCFIHASDLHIDSPLHGLERYEGAPTDTIRNSTRRALENLVQLACDQKVAFVAIAGDLYDGDWRDYNTGLYFSSQMARLKDAGIRVFIVAGNHDAASQISLTLKMPDNVRKLSADKPESVVIDDLGVAIHGQSFPTQAVTGNLAANYPVPIRGLLNVGLLHTSVDGREGHAPYAPCSVAELKAKNYDYWGLGHVHKAEVLSELPWIVFPGNTQGRHARETGAKGCVVVRIRHGRVRAVESAALDVVRWSVCDLDSTGDHSPEDLLKRAEETLKPVVADAHGRLSAVRLVVRPSSELHAKLIDDWDRWTNELRRLGTEVGAGQIWIEKIKLHPPPTETVMPQLGAWGPLVAAIEAADEALPDDVVSDLKALRAAMPGELKDGDDGARIEDPESRRAVLQEARRVLMSRLGGGATSQ